MLFGASQSQYFSERNGEDLAVNNPSVPKSPRKGALLWSKMEGKAEQSRPTRRSFATVTDATFVDKWGSGWEHVLGGVHMYKFISCGKGATTLNIYQKQSNL